MTYRVLIVGAGGWGREVLAQMQGDPACGDVWYVGGFLDSRVQMLDGLDCGIAIVGDPATYVPQGDDHFVCAIGDPRARESFTAELREQGARFIALRTGAFMSPRVQVGAGCILCHRVQLSPDVVLGEFSNVHSNTMLGHDVRVGRYAQIGAMVFVGGGACIGERAVVHPHATILPGVRIGNDAVVGAGSVVIKDVADGATVFGNPARPVFQKSL